MYYKRANDDEGSVGDTRITAAESDPLIPSAVVEADQETALMNRAITALDEPTTNPRRKTTKRKATRSIVIDSEPIVGPACNQSPLLVGYEQGAIAGIVAKLTRDITTYGGEESYAELDDYLRHGHPDIQYHLRQALTLAILNGARKAAMYAARLRRPSGGRPFVGWSYQEVEKQLAQLEGGYETFWGGDPRRDSSAISLLGSSSSYRYGFDARRRSKNTKRRRTDNPG